MAEKWLDDPISSVAEDRLGRVDLAKRVARLITETHSERSSVVHGLVGAWGSGKTSVLALTEQELARSDDEWIVVHFAPWATSDLNGLLAEFYGALVEALPRKQGVAKFKRALAEVMSATAPLVNVAGALAGVGQVGDVAQEGADLLRREKSWSARFSDASRDLRKLDIKLLVIADDIDRLHGDELLNFLRLVRMVGRFPGLSYLIAYDEAGLLSSIEAAGTAVVGSERAQDFLEKFVQYPIYLPPLIEVQILDLLNEALNPIIANSDHRFEVEGERLSFAHAWVDLLDTPRSINRFAAQLRLVLPLHKPREVDLIDVILLTLIRLHAPNVFDAISRSKSLLTSSVPSKDPFDWSVIVGDRVPDHSLAAVRELVARLFPVASARGASKVGPLRIASPDYFDRYFLQGIPDDDIADATVHFVIDQANGGNSVPLDALLQGASSDSVRARMHSKLQQFSLWGEEPGSTPAAALKAVIRSRSLTSNNSNSSLSTAYDSGLRWAEKMLLCLPADVSAAEVKDVLSSCADETERIILLENVAYSLDAAPPAGVVAVASDVALSLLDGVLENVAEGDSADLFGIVERWTPLVRAFALERGRQRLANALADGMSANDLAARFVAIARWRGGRQGTTLEIGSFLWDAYRDLLPDGLATSEPNAAIAPDVEDVSWPARRHYAQRALAEERRLRSTVSPQA